jgi:hypothetical protein
VRRFACRPISCTASATDDTGTSAMTSTPSVSNHRRAVAEPMSVLFWWSPEITSIRTPLICPPASSTAILAAVSDPGPPRSE